MRDRILKKTTSLTALCWAAFLGSSLTSFGVQAQESQADIANPLRATQIAPLTSREAGRAQQNTPKEVPKPRPANQEDVDKKKLNLPEAGAFSINESSQSVTTLTPTGTSILQKVPGRNRLSSTLYVDGLAAQNGSPPDTTGAIGPVSYIQTVNSRAAIYNRSGVQLAIGTLNNLAGYSSAPNSFDPQMIWDATTNRYYYVMDSVFSNSDNRLAFGWSKTSNPSNLTSDWCHYEIKEGSRFPDYPKLGDATGFIEIGVNAFTSSFQGSDLFVINKPSAGSTCPGTAPTGGVFRNLKDSGNSLIFTPVPSNQIDNNEKGYVVARNLSLPATKLPLFEITKTSSGFTLTKKSVTVSAYDVPMNAKQPTYGQLIDTSDTRPTQAVQAIDPSSNSFSLYTQHTIKNGTNSSYVRFYKINPVPTTAVLQAWGNIGDANNFAYNGSISPDRVKDGSFSNYGKSFGLTFNVSSSTNGISPRIHGCFAPNGANLTCGYYANAVGPYRDFTCKNTGNVCRWGDYSSVTPDPKATGTYGTLWGTIQWSGLSSPSVSNANFRTKILTIKN